VYIAKIERFSRGVLGVRTCTPTSCATVEGPAKSGTLRGIRLIRNVAAYPKYKRPSRIHLGSRVHVRIHLVFVEYNVYSCLRPDSGGEFDPIRPGPHESGLAHPRADVYSGYTSEAAKTL